MKMWGGSKGKERRVSIVPKVKEKERKKKILYINATVSLLCGQCLEDFFSHCPFPVEFLIASVFSHLEFACTGGVHQNLDMEFLRI
jgi:hypothetical protein